MATYLAPEVLDNGIAYLQANCNQLAAVKAYAVGDSYATVMDGTNVTVSAAMTSADFTLGNGASNARTITSASKTATATGSGDPTHFVFVSTSASKILGAATETSATSVSSGTQYTLPSLTLTMGQPV